MRIAIGGIHIECSTANPVLTRSEDFKVARGTEILEHPNFHYLSESTHELFPILHARALPGGPVAREAYEALKAEYLQGLQAAMPLDGVYLALHGAMFVDGLRDSEGDWAAATREIVGPDCVIIGSFDLHGNLSQRLIDALDGLSNYRTAPHIDVLETQERAFRMLTQSLETGQRLTLSWAKIPVLLPGERTSTEDEPARSLYAQLPDFDAHPGVLEAALFVGYVWADEPRATASAVITGLNLPPSEQSELTSKLAQSYWDARHDFVFGARVGSVAECVQWAKESKTSPVILADSGDNPTGGGVGDRADVLAELLKQQATGVVMAGITDAPAVQAAFAAGEGAELELLIGATLDPAGERCAFKGKVLKLDTSDNRQAVLVGQGITLVVAEKRRPYHYLSDFAQLGLNPLDFQVLVVKSGYLSPELAPIARPNLLALSQGVVDQDIPHLVRQEIQRPMFPWDDDFDWQPQVYFSVSK